MAECMALACPRLHNTDYDNRELSLNVPSTLIAYSATGHAFCNHCWKQRRLLDWAHKRQFPAIRAMCEGLGYVAIGEGEWNWITSIIGNRKEAIDAFFTEAIGDNVPEEFGDIQKVVNSRRSRPMYVSRRR